MGWWGNSYTIRRAAKCAVTKFDAPFYSKLDPDALMIGPGLLSRIKGFSESHPEAGLFGNYMFTPTGQERSFSYWAKKMAQNQEHLNPPLRCALDNGYRIGSGVQGGAYCLTRACLKKMDGHGYLDKWNHHYDKGRGIVEDHIMTMLTYAVGYTAMDFGLSGQPFACKHRELAMLPHELIRDDRILIHPLKHNDTTSAKNRAYFRGLRRENEK